MLDKCIDLARRTRIPLIVACSKDVSASQVIEVIDKTSDPIIEAYAIDLPPDNHLGIPFATSHKELTAASPDWGRDLSAKRNLGLILARLRGWTRLMFLDDDIYDIDEGDVDALATALDDHSVSALIPEQFPDNSVACHAHRLGRGGQKVFASASGIGVKCDRENLSFFPNIYNEDWFFFSEEAASHKIAKVGVSRQIAYDPYKNPLRAAQEEFGDLLAEGLYARLDRSEDIPGVDIDYWSSFIEIRMAFHKRVEEALAKFSDAELAAKALDLGYISDPGLAARIHNSIRAAQDQLKEITPSLCQRFVDSWQSDLIKWRRYLTKLPHADTTVDAFNHLGFDPAISSFNSR
jgi:glycosyltransferase involved in cell wall biosynthesis